MKKVICFAFMLLSGLVNAQISDDGSRVDFFSGNKLRTSDWRKTFNVDNIEGTPFMNEDFIIGTIYTNSETTYDNVPLRYNIFGDMLEFKNDKNVVLGMSNPETIEKVVFGDVTLVYKPFQSGKSTKEGFFQLLFEGEATLLAKMNVIFTDEVKPAPYKEATPAKLERKEDTYYILIGNDSAQEISNKNDILKILPGHDDELVNFMKANKVKTNKPDKLIELVEYYNSLD